MRAHFLSATALALLAPLQAFAFDCYRSQPYIENKARSSVVFDEIRATSDRTTDVLMKQGLSKEQANLREKEIPKTPVEEALQDKLKMMAERIIQVADAPEQNQSSCSRLIELETEFGRLLIEYATSRLHTVVKYANPSPQSLTEQ